MKKSKFLKGFVTVFLSVFIICQINAPCYAYNEADYVFDPNVGLSYIPVTYNAVRAQGYFGNQVAQLNKPEDIFIDQKDHIYIVDSGNNRIVMMDENMEHVRALSNFDGETLNNPQGIYVYDNGNMLIADTDNGRILKVSPEGKLLKTFVKPESDLYDSSYAFRPTKVCINSIDQIFILNKDDYHGLTIIDEENTFRGYMASTKLQYSAVDHAIQTFASESQKKKIAKRIPPTNSNFLIDQKNAIYTTTIHTDQGQLKKFSTIGKNTYPYGGRFGDRYIDYVLLHYGKKNTDPEFVDLCVDSDGIINMVDNISGRIYQYDGNGNNLMVFGGTGNWSGKFLSASSIAINSKGNIFVLDSTQNLVHMMKPTEFTLLIHKALKNYEDGKYDKAVEYWRQVMDISPNYPMAHKGMGDSYLRNGEYRKAMQEYRISFYLPGYSEAFDAQLLLTVREHFAFVLFGILAIAILIMLLFKYFHKAYKRSFEKPVRSRWFRRGSRFRILLGSVFDPMEGFRTIREQRSEFDVTLPLILYGLVLVSRVASIYLTHFPFQKDFYNRNIGMELLNLVIPLLTWVTCNYLVTTIRSGEVRISEVFSASAYSMIPYILITVPLALFSNVLSLSSLSLYNGINNIMWIWIFILFFVNVMSMNSYSFTETVKVALITLLSIVFIWIILGLLFMLGEELVDFLKDVWGSYRMYFQMN